MSEEKFREWISSEFEKEAEELEKRLQEHEAADPELAALEMPEHSFDDLMRRIKAEEENKNISKNENGPAKKPFRIRKRTLLAVAAAAILVAAMGAGVTGAKLFVPKVENRSEDGDFNTTIINGEMEEDRDISEKDAYQEIEDRLGIQALRLNDKPQDMVLEKVYIDDVMGEAQMEFRYKGGMLIIYENKQNEDSAFDKKTDGEIVDTVDIFHLNKKVEIFKIDKGDNSNSYVIQLEQGNAYYYVISDLNLEEFEQIIMGIIFESVGFLVPYSYCYCNY